MRILAASKPLPLEKMGFSDRNLQGVQGDPRTSPTGSSWCVGPTGSGKTTTLHSALGYINTVETQDLDRRGPGGDHPAGPPPGPDQRRRSGFTFAAAMRSFLRADPDVIMVGEMRDHETAAIGIEASLTGHLVLSTLHTNSRPGDHHPPARHGHRPLQLRRRAARRSSPSGWCGRCAASARRRTTRPRRSSTSCMQDYGRELWPSLGVAYSPGAQARSARAGCTKCGDTGYEGRMGIHELLIGLGRDQAPDPEARHGGGDPDPGASRRA